MRPTRARSAKRQPTRAAQTADCTEPPRGAGAQPPASLTFHREPPPLLCRAGDLLGVTVGEGEPVVTSVNGEQLPQPVPVTAVDTPDEIWIPLPRPVAVGTALAINHTTQSNGESNDS